MGITEDTPSFQHGDTDRCDNLFSYRAWPIFMIAFFRLFFISIFERAFQNYIYYDIDVSESMLGLISSAPLMAYIFGPILGHFITKKLGIRNSIMLSAIGTPFLVGLQMIYFEPFYLIFLRVINGLLLGVFWPNCYSLLSKWQRVSSDEKSNKNFRQFNFSWNLGFISGLIVGLTLAFSIGDYFTMTFAFIISFMLPILSFFIKKESEINHIIKPVLNNNQNLNALEVGEANLTKKLNNKMTVYPIIFSWLALIVYSLSKSMFRFSYPVFLKPFENFSYFTYLIQLLIQVGQLGGLTWSNSMKIHTRKLSVFVSITMIILGSLAILLLQDILSISIISACIGLFVGLIQGTSLKIMIDYNAANNTKKFSTINEILKGIGFGLTPIAAGIIAEINIFANFVFLIFFGMFSLSMLIFLSRNVKRKKF
ncbi:MAG: MFS transporter [Promethearchaeota archaeon]